MQTKKLKQIKNDLKRLDEKYIVRKGVLYNRIVETAIFQKQETYKKKKIHTTKEKITQ